MTSLYGLTSWHGKGNMIRQDVTLIKEMRRQHFEHEKRVKKKHKDRSTLLLFAIDHIK